MIMLKQFFMRLVIYALFECRSCGNQQNLTIYSTLSYFNFFFDCFLGFMSCLNRIWKTTLISVFYIIRLDISMFNENNNIILKNLDTGHVVFKNFVFLEHSFNNPVINGFCEILIETMFLSFICEKNLNNPYCECTSQGKIRRTYKITAKRSFICCKKCQNENEIESKNGNDNQQTLIKSKYKSYARLRTYIYLYYALRRFPKLRKPPIDNGKEGIRHSFIAVQKELKNFTIENEDLETFLFEKGNSEKFKINNLYVCLLINENREESQEINLLKKVLEYLPKNGGEYTDNLSSLIFLNTSTMDYFLFTIWLSCQNIGIKKTLENAESTETYKVLFQVVHLISESNWNKAKYKWLEHVGKIASNENKKEIDCAGTLNDFFITKMQPLQMYQREEICESCVDNTDQMYDSRLLLTEVMETVGLNLKCTHQDEKCNHRKCNSETLTQNITLFGSPIWIITEILFDCKYNKVPLIVQIDKYAYKLVCCITKKTKEQFKAIVFINHMFYEVDNFEHSINRIKASCDSSVVCAIYERNIV